MRYKEALSNATCPNCGAPASIGEMSFDEQHLRIDNVRLREEVNNREHVHVDRAINESSQGELNLVCSSLLFIKFFVSLNSNSMKI